MFKKILITIAAILVLIVIGGFIYVNHLKKSPQPNYEQNVFLPTLKDKVLVIRDQWGMPHIYAKNLTDLYTVLGYIMAQDRLWHMDLIRRATEGRLSEIFGKEFVETDLLLRALRIRQKSEYLLGKLPDSIQNYLNAFCEGVNYYINTHQNNLPLEFKILNYKPEPWLPQHTLNLIGFMAWDLGMGWRGDLILWQIAQKVDSAKLALAIPNFDKNSTIYYDFKIEKIDSAQIPQLSKDIDKITAQIQSLGVIPFTASNNWAVAPKKSVYNKPILANDMHLGFNLPGIWYQAHLIVPGKLNVIGVTLPGAPGIVAGHNQYIAWGMTNVMLDDMDFYIEKINQDTTKYLVDGKWRNFIIYNEKIITKEGDTIVKKLRFTHRGPVISGFKNIKGYVISAAWNGYDTLSNELMGVFSLNFAKNWQDFVNATKYFRSVAQNIIYADIYGNIGIHMGAGIPIRKKPGYLPYPGDTSKYDWQGFVPFELLPYVYNPESGILASANNKSAENYPFYISQYFFQPYRYDRIVELLKQKDKLSTDDFKKIQTDWKSKLVEKTLPKIIFEVAKINTDDKTVKTAIEILAKWDGVMSPESPAPLIFEEFFYQLVRLAMVDEIGEKLFYKYIDNKIFANTMFENIVNDPFNPWIDNINTKEVEDYSWIMQTAFLNAIDTLKNKLGKNPKHWEYQKLHTLTFEHPLGKVKILNFLFNLNKGPYKVGGASHTVCPYSFYETQRYKVFAGASQRHIFVVGDWDKGWMVIPTGNSGLPGDEFYANQTDDYINGIYHPEPYSDSAVLKYKKYQREFYPKQ